MLPLIGVPLTTRQPTHPVLVGKASLVIGVTGRSPSVGGEGAILSGTELKSAIKKARLALLSKPAYFLVALVAEVNSQYFQALSIHYSNGNLRLYDATFRTDTLNIITHKPLFKDFDMLYNWNGVEGIGRLWFEIEIEASHEHQEAVIESRSGTSTRVGLNTLGKSFLAPGDELE
jgi:hypothetical protein